LEYSKARAKQQGRSEKSFDDVAGALSIPLAACRLCAI
jgi:hypothetical protein